MYSLGEVLRIERTRKHLNQQELAQIIGVTKETYGNKEKGKTQFTVVELMQICQKLELDPCVILGKLS